MVAFVFGTEKRDRNFYARANQDGSPVFGFEIMPIMEGFL
ncbi:hypothetical protein EYZ11_008972 [Aspergillus tanneri]|uniref:Uncharacterized protein n=1 Tax=Aspergillus tanneri TaxID=1220188 RepID=A0A4S3JB99_9EURO|nr:hypothetical protein EYZ11_008972 [Aspergillus tanneri]